MDQSGGAHRCRHLQAPTTTESDGERCVREGTRGAYPSVLFILIVCYNNRSCRAIALDSSGRQDHSGNTQ